MQHLLCIKNGPIIFSPGNSYAPIFEDTNLPIRFHEDFLHPTTDNFVHPNTPYLVIEVDIFKCMRDGMRKACNPLALCMLCGISAYGELPR